MKVLVTGCIGMIGTQFLELLLDSDIRVIGCDNFARGTKENLDHLEQYAENKKVANSINSTLLNTRLTAKYRKSLL